MIPFPIAPLKALSVLVTRPAEQGKSLCERIGAMGGEAISFPTIAIEPLIPDSPAPAYDWLVFVSVNAVTHGLPHVQRTEKTRIAAIGKATAAALDAHSVPIDAVPEAGSTSEALLAHPALSNLDGQSVLIVKGDGGRDLLQDALLKRGARVASVDVYRRVLPSVPAETVHRLEQRWQEEGIDIVTFTSVETLDNLTALLTAAGRSYLRSAAFVAVSERIATAARSRGLEGTCVLARNPDDESIVGTIAAWHSRAR